MEYDDHYRSQMGTENVAPLLRSLIRMVRPQRVLEIGAGYTTPFLLDGLEKNEELFDDGSGRCLNKEYAKNHKENYDPKLVILDTSVEYDLKERGFNFDSKYVEFIHGKFQGRSEELFDKYGKFDMVWFDCGGPQEYKDFLFEYWNICTHYMIFHYTFFQGQPNTNIDIISSTIDAWTRLMGASNVQRIDISEPHKMQQGSITMLKKVHWPTRVRGSEVQRSFKCEPVSYNLNYTKEDLDMLGIHKYKRQKMKNSVSM